MNDATPLPMIEQAVPELAEADESARTILRKFGRRG